MKRVVTLVLVLSGLVSAISAGQRVEMGNIAEDVRVTVIESNDQKTIVSFEIGAFSKQEVQIDGETYYTIKTGEENVLHNEGEPALPRICRSIIIPDNARMKIDLLSSEYRDFDATPVAPSKGHLPRTVNPQDIPYNFGPVYNLDEWYPSQQAAIREPYILRDLRGTVIEIYPFQYNPVNQTLRVYTSIAVEVTTDGIDRINVLNRVKPFDNVNPDFELIYKERFINYDQGTLLYSPVQEIGDMLIITYASFAGAMQPLVDWKRQKGIKTTIVNVSTIGNNSTSIANYIQTFYDSTDLAWVLLVGDAAQVATPTASSGSSDPSYAKVHGSDNYPDIFIGRFSAETAAQVQTQVERTINYEKYPSTANWHNRATGIASDQGPGHYNEYDYEHMNYIRQDLLAYNYTSVDQIYDPGATQTMVANALNAGRGFVNYTGHGSTDAWGTTDFSSTNVNALTNTGMLPFIHSVACVNGNFNGYTCFAEAWLRATHNNLPSGAIATYMSSINQDWDPPMDAQDETTDLLVAEAKTTIGGLCYNGSCLMMDLNGTSGVNMYNTWHIFGDPSVMLCTDIPAAMAVTHDAAVLFTASQFNVMVSGVEGALCALYGNGILYGSAYTSAGGSATINIAESLPIGQNITLTVTAYNKQPYFGDIQVISPDGAYVIYDSHAINDAAGNDNGLIDFGESVLLDMQLQNVGPDAAANVSAVLTTTDSYATITDGTQNFGTIPGNFGTISIANAYAFNVSANTPDGHNIPFHLVITGTSRDTWTGDFVIPVHAPVVGFAAAVINDEAGNSNGILEAGETASVIVSLINDGSGTAYGVAGTLSESDAYVTITDPGGSFGNLNPSGGTGDNAGDAFVVVADASFPQGHSVTFNLAITADGGYTNTLQFELRAAESFENSNGGYTGAGNWQWGVPIYGPPGAYFGTKVWGTNLSGDYGLNRNDALISPLIYVRSPEAILEFYHWYHTEDYYDGGNVAVSTNGGSSWTMIVPTGGYPSSNIYALGEPGYDNQSGGWVRAEFSLAAYVNQDIKIRWRFASDGVYNYAGWYIDDVSIINNIPLPPPLLAYNPSLFTVSTESGELETRTLALNNTGDGPLYYQLAAQTDESLALNIGKTLPAKTALLRQEPIGYAELSDKSGARPEPYYPPVITSLGGPDEYGYFWKDSNEPGGPNYNWVNITSLGTQITGLGDDTNTGPFPIGFDFEFYGNTFNSFRFSTNGFVTFTSTASAYSNQAIPYGDGPFNLIAPFWDDLNFNSGGNAYYYSNNSDSLIVSWVNVPHYSTGDPLGPYTFQIILLGSGKIIYQYQDINPPDNSATIGIQNGAGSIGLEVVYNAAYIQENLAIMLTTQTGWLEASPLSGTVPAHSSANATITFDASELNDGTYTGAIFLASNDPVNPDAEIPVIFVIGSQGDPEMSIVPGSIVDSLIEGQQAQHNLVISNNGNGPLSASFASDEPWLLFDNTPLSIPPSLGDTLIVTIDAEGMVSGNYAGAIDFSSNDPGIPTGSIPVSLHVYYPDLTATPIEISESALEGEQTVTYIALGNTGLGRLEYTVVYGEIVLAASGDIKQPDAKTDNHDNIIPNREITDVWLTVAPVEGSVNYGETDSLTVTLNAAELEAELYYGMITISSNDPDEINIDIAVTFNVAGTYICDYTPGDINGDGAVISADVTYGINFFRGTGAAPSDSCFNEQTQTWLYVAGDVNGDCAFIGSDITYLVNFFRGINDPLNFCPALPPNPPTAPAVVRPDEVKTIKTQ